MFPFNDPSFPDLQNCLGYKDLAGVASMSELEHSFQVERARHEGTGRQVSLLVFLPRGEGAPPLAAFVEGLRKSMRVTDILGWLDSDRLAILLPGTSKLGAWGLAKGFLENLTSASTRFDCEVFTYPSDWPRHAYDELRATGSDAQPLSPAG
jgi:hypothetical protein